MNQENRNTRINFIYRDNQGRIIPSTADLKSRTNKKVAAKAVSKPALTKKPVMAKKAAVIKKKNSITLKKKGSASSVKRNSIKKGGTKRGRK